MAKKRLINIIFKSYHGGKVCHKLIMWNNWTINVAICNGLHYLCNLSTSNSPLSENCYLAQTLGQTLLHSQGKRYSASVFMITSDKDKTFTSCFHVSAFYNGHSLFIHMSLARLFCFSVYDAFLFRLFRAAHNVNVKWRELLAYWEQLCLKESLTIKSAVCIQYICLKFIVLRTFDLYNTVTIHSQFYNSWNTLEHWMCKMIQIVNSSIQSNYYHTNITVSFIIQWNPYFTSLV